MGNYADNKVECRFRDELASDAAEAMKGLSVFPKEFGPINEFFASRGVAQKVDCPEGVDVCVELIDARTFRYSALSEDAVPVLDLCAALESGFSKLGIEHIYEFSDQDAGCVFHTRNSRDEWTNYAPGEGGDHDHIIYDAMGTGEHWTVLDACIGAIDLLRARGRS